MKNAQFNVRDVKKVGEKKLHIKFKSGKEFNGWFKLNGIKTKRITIPKGRKNIPRGTYSTMARQLGLSVSDFDLLLECPLTKEKYEKIISK
ncbi:MAG: hypothetical protein U9P10_14775 [Thermodesulfobacteriota bacterium]|nr:hypothetical protein [Thermodesulfobacteriota bacterium]